MAVPPDLPICRFRWRCEPSSVSEQHPGESHGVRRGQSPGFPSGLVSRTPLMQVLPDGRPKRVELFEESNVFAKSERSGVAVPKAVVAHVDDPPTLGIFESSKIQYDVSAPSLDPRVGGAVDHLALLAGSATLAAREAERHEHGVQDCDDPHDRVISRWIVGRSHLTILVVRLGLWRPAAVFWRAGLHPAVDGPEALQGFGPRAAPRELRHASRRLHRRIQPLLRRPGRGR